jgi:hypothetical protein
VRKTKSTVRKHKTTKKNRINRRCRQRVIQLSTKNRNKRRAKRGKWKRRVNSAKIKPKWRCVSVVIRASENQRQPQRYQELGAENCLDDRSFQKRVLYSVCDHIASDSISNQQYPFIRILSSGFLCFSYFRSDFMFFSSLYLFVLSFSTANHEHANVPRVSHKEQSYFSP